MGAEFVQFIAALTVCLGRFGRNGWIHPILPNRPRQNSNRVKELNNFCSPNRRNDLCLAFYFHPSLMPIVQYTEYSTGTYLRCCSIVYSTIVDQRTLAVAKIIECPLELWFFTENNKFHFENVNSSKHFFFYKKKHKYVITTNNNNYLIRMKCESFFVLNIFLCRISRQQYTFFKYIFLAEIQFCASPFQHSYDCRDTGGPQNDTGGELGFPKPPIRGAHLGLSFSVMPV